MSGPRSGAPGTDTTGGGAEEDRALVAAANAGDRDALERLLRRHHDRLHLLCRRLCSDRGDAEDATQNALVAIVRGLPRYDGRAEFTTWAHRVTTNACLDELRRRARRPLLLASDGTGEDGVDGDRAPGRHLGVSSDGKDPADAAVGAEERRRLQHALDELDETFRVPVVLRDVADLDYAEIAELLELAPGTVRSRIARGRAKLAAMLDLGTPSAQEPGNRAAQEPGNRAAQEPGNRAAQEPGNRAASESGNRAASRDVRTEDAP